MPPKRRQKKDDDADQSNILIDNNSNSSATDEPTSKKQKIDEPTFSSQKSSSGSQSASQDTNLIDDENDGRPECQYGARCYRKNPQHHKEFRHPKKQSTITTTTTSIPDTVKPPQPIVTSLTPDLQGYESILQITLGKNKISPDEKKLLRQYRKKHGISDADHVKLLKQFGWTEDEYEDGERQDDDIELDEERTILQDEKGFRIIKITKEEANKSKQHLNVFSKVCTKFYETMSKAQANFTVTEVGVVVSTKLKRQYDKRKNEITQKHNEPVKEDWGFHGTSRDSIHNIAQTGFLHPDELKEKSAKAKKTKGKSYKPKHEKPVELLDDGYFGRGIYFTTFSDYALWYSEERESDQVLLCKLLTGKSYKCTKRMDGQDCEYGYDCHISPKGNEIVIFAPEQIMPRYIITFATKEAEEREQES